MPDGCPEEIGELLTRAEADGLRNAIDDANYTDTDKVVTIRGLKALVDV